MTGLSDGEIRELIEAGEIGLIPYTPSMIQPASMDVRLDGEFLTMFPGRNPVIDPYQEPSDFYTYSDHRDGEPFSLASGQFALGSTLELITIPNNLICRIEGKSSLGRLGLIVHATAGYVDPGFSGHVTLEFYNVAPVPIRLHPGMKIAQLSFMKLGRPCEMPYGSGATGSKYQGQKGPTPSGYYLNDKPDFTELLAEFKEQFAASNS